MVKGKETIFSQIKICSYVTVMQQPALASISSNAYIQMHEQKAFSTTFNQKSYLL